MKVVQINAVCGKGSTGKICVEVSKLLSEHGIENYIMYTGGTCENPKWISYANRAYIKLQALFSRVFGTYGFHSFTATKKLIRYLDQIHPDIVHLHNIHGHNCNLDRLFVYLKSHNIRVLWTFHDCWAFTGYCPHYDMIGCDKWQSQCAVCPQYKSFSFFFDKSTELFLRKKQLFSDLDLTIITPSEWLADEVKKSFLKDYSIRVINNGIDLQVFRPASADFKKAKGIEHKKVVLGVAFGWSERKGLDVFLRLYSDLDDSYQIVLVGTDKKTDAVLPSGILSIHRTANQQELAEIYAAADVFVNPTRAENFPTTNIEALACGTPVVTFHTGGSAEMLTDKTGVVVKRDDYAALLAAVKDVCTKNIFKRDACRKQAEKYESAKCFDQYIQLYLEQERS